MNFRLLLGCGALLVLAAAYLLGHEGNTPGTPADATGQQADYGYVALDAQMLQTTEQGKPLYTFSAARIAQGVAARTGIRPAVLISDSFGRPWRMGVTNVAIGLSGMAALVDQRGHQDRDGRVLQVTQIALGDAVAAAAGLVMGEGSEGVPAALVRGLSALGPPQGAGAVLRPREEDMFQ